PAVRSSSSARATWRRRQPAGGSHTWTRAESLRRGRRRSCELPRRSSSIGRGVTTRVRLRGRRARCPTSGTCARPGASRASRYRRSTRRASRGSCATSWRCPRSALPSWCRSTWNRRSSRSRDRERMSSPPIIRTRSLTRRFGQFTAVDQLTIEVTPGSIFAFLGANGSGKSTTIRMLIGLLRPTAGEVEVDGVDVLRHPRRVRDRIGYMGQKVSLYQGLSLRENVEFYAGLYGLAGGDLEG